MSKIVDAVYSAIEKVLTDLGYELIDVTYQKEFGEMHLTVVINKDGGIGFDDLEKVNDILDPLLDELDPTGGEPYHLDVSSMGLDRPITTNKDFDRNIDCPVNVTLYKPIDKKKKLVGTLVSYTDEVVTVSVSGKELTIDRKSISVIKPEITF